MSRTATPLPSQYPSLKAAGDRASGSSLNTRTLLSTSPGAIVRLSLAGVRPTSTSAARCVSSRIAVGGAGVPRSCVDDRRLYRLPTMPRPACEDRAGTCAQLVRELINLGRGVQGSNK